MISAGEVGAVFKVVDEASPALRRILEQMNALTAAVDRTQLALKSLTMPPGLNRSLGLTEKRFANIADASKVTGDVVASTFVKIDRAAAATASNVANIGRELKAIGAEARAMGGLGSLRYGGGPRGPGGGGGVHFGGASVPLPGEQHARITGGPLLAAGGALAYGTYEEASIEDFINRIFRTGGIPLGTPNAQNPLFKVTRDAILKAYVQTGLPLEQIEEGILTGTRGLSGLSLEKRLALMPFLLQSSATEAYLKSGTSMPEAMEAFVGLAHMEGKYAPDEIARMADHFAFLSTTTPVSVEQLKNAAGYSIPLLRTADFDPDQVLLMMTAMERAGITNTKAGTWISQLALNSFPGTSFMSKMMFRKHEDAMKQLGLVDDHDQPTWFTNGRPDLVRMTNIAGEHIAAMDAGHRLAVEKALWGAQGGRAAGFFADPTNRAVMAAVAGEEKNFASSADLWTANGANSPIVQFRQALAGLNVELINMGSNVLPFVTGALRAANQQLGSKGELTAIGGGLLAFALGGWKGLRGFGLGATAGATLYEGTKAIADWLLPAPNAAAAAHLQDIESLGPLRRFFTPGSASAATAPDGYGSKPFGYMNSQNLQGIGNIPPRSMVIPQVTVNDSPKVTVNVTLDGRAIAAAVSAQIVRDNRVTNSAAGFDFRAGFAGPDTRD
jgi:hypothetical protein